jgi:hypothetical protein
MLEYARNKKPMKHAKILAILIIPLLLTGCGGTSEPQIGDELVWDDYKKVSVTADVEITPNTAISDDISTYIGSATFMMDFWFAPGGGDPMHQEASWQLTGYEHYASGNATPCTGTPSREAWVERDLDVTATLAPTDEDEDVDDFKFHVSNLPMGESFMVTRVCGGAPATSPDPAILTQLVLPLYQEQWQILIREESTDVSVSENVDLSGMAFADVTIATTMKRVTSIDK